jgi:tRNA-dihydrouridine synthase
MSKVPADWSTVERTREIRDQMNKDALIIGNGDVESLTEAKKRADETGVEGVMVGRGAFGNPWFFNPDIERDKLPAKKRLSVMVEHAKTFDELLPDQHFAVMRKHFKAYTKGVPHANDLRNDLMQTENSQQVERIANTYLSHNQ